MAVGWLCCCCCGGCYLSLQVAPKKIRRDPLLQLELKKHWLLILIFFGWWCASASKEPGWWSHRLWVLIFHQFNSSTFPSKLMLHFQKPRQMEDSEEDFDESLQGSKASFAARASGWSWGVKDHGRSTSHVTSTT